MPLFLVYYDATLSFSDSVCVEAESAEAAEAQVQATLNNAPPDISHLGPEHLGDVTVWHVEEEDEPPTS